VSEGVLNADIALYGNAAAVDSPPPAIPSDPLVEAGTPIEQLLRVLGLAANTSDPFDAAAGLDEYAGRDGAMTDAADGFANQDTAASSAMSQIPQIAAGIAGAIAGALQPLLQIPTQFAQGAQQALQTGTALVSELGAGPPVMPDDPAALDAGSIDDGSLDESLAPAEDFSAAATPGDLQSDPGGGATVPMALLGPAPLPTASTAPAAAPGLPPVPLTGSPSGGGTAVPAGMAGMPMIPPGPLHAATDRAAPPDTKRVTVPGVPNGAPVQGRIISPPPGPPATRTVEDRSVAARRIGAPAAEPASGTA